MKPNPVNAARPLRADEAPKSRLAGLSRKVRRGYLTWKEGAGEWETAGVMLRTGRRAEQQTM